MGQPMLTQRILKVSAFWHTVHALEVAAINQANAQVVDTICRRCVGGGHKKGLEKVLLIGYDFYKRTTVF